MKFLFEFFQIPPNIDIPCSLENIKASTNGLAETLMADLLENHRMSEENRRMSEQIRILEQKLQEEKQNKEDASRLL